MCFPDGEFLTGAGDVLVGDIEGCPSPATSTPATRSPATRSPVTPQQE
jgi:uncharacterized protein (DUF779 family)